MAITIPIERYTTADWHQRELDHVWTSAWQLACSLDHVAQAGDFFEHRLGPYSIVIVRGDDGALRAFQNVCQHRGSAICEGSGSGLTELRCPFHRWTWDLDGNLREIPSRKEFGGIRNEDLPLPKVAVDAWGPLVFVNMDPNAAPLADWLEGIPDDIAWAGLDDFRCTAFISIPARCNWKTLIEGFSETYHVQGIHREMLWMTDDVNGPERLWDRHGKLEQPYGLPSPRWRDQPTDQQVWEGFIEVMGGRIGIESKEDAGPCPAIPEGSTLRAVIADMVRAKAAESGLDFSMFDDRQVMDLNQYNLFPNITVLVIADLLSVVRARPGATHLDAFMDVFAFARKPAGDTSPRTKPIDVQLPHGADPPFGLVLNQDVGNFERTQLGMHQPGLRQLTVSGTYERRLVNLHRNLERAMGISPTQLGNLDELAFS